MAKKTASPTLETLIPSYGKEKEILDQYKKSTDATNKQIKKLMSEQELTEKEAGGYLVKYSVSVSEKYNMEVLLEYMHKHKEFASCIKTSEYVDETVLEDLIYQGAISKTRIAELAKFRSITETPKLTVKKVKEVD